MSQYLTGYKLDKDEIIFNRCILKIVSSTRVLFTSLLNSKNIISFRFKTNLIASIINKIDLLDKKDKNYQKINYVFKINGK